MSNPDNKNSDLKTGETTHGFSMPDEEKGQEVVTTYEQFERRVKELNKIREQVISDAAYENRVVFFLDVLGWGKLVNASATDLEVFSKIINTVVNYKSVAEGLHSKGPDDPFDARITHFSDSLVISLPESDARPGRLEFFLLPLITTSMRLGLFIRGGITIGKMYHKEGMVFGPALNRAYELESKHALYPRVLLDEAIYKKWPEARLKERWRKFRDEHYFYDFIKRICRNKISKKDLDPLKNAIETGLKQYSQDGKVLSKYCWLAQYFNESTPDGVFIETKWLGLINNNVCGNKVDNKGH